MSVKDHYGLEKLQSTNLSRVTLIFHTSGSLVEHLRIVPEY